MTSGVTLGHIEEFDSAMGDWSMYVEQLVNYFHGQWHLCQREEASRPIVCHGRCNVQDYTECGVSEQAGGENVRRPGGSSFAAF